MQIKIYLALLQCLNAMPSAAELARSVLLYNVCQMVFFLSNLDFFDNITAKVTNKSYSAKFPWIFLWISWKSCIFAEKLYFVV